MTIQTTNRGISDQDLLKAVKKIGIKKFDGVFMKEMVILYPVMQNKGILNIGDDIGTHWTCYYIENDLNERVVNYFDSFGLGMPDAFRERFNDEIGTYIIENMSKIQHNNSILCGMYCIYVINEIEKGRKLGDIILDFSNKKTELKANDAKLIKYFKDYKIEIKI